MLNSVGARVLYLYLRHHEVICLLYLCTKGDAAPGARKMTPAGIDRLRRTLNPSTPVFGANLNVTPDTVRSWEKNRRQPSGPALRLLQIAGKQPGILRASA